MNWIEMIGYLGSLLVLVSFLLTSVVKLRIVNTIGSIIFAVYAFIIRSYPTAVMNICLVGINLYQLWKATKSVKAYELAETDTEDGLLRYLLDTYRKDMENIFPGLSLEPLDADKAYVVFHEGKPVGITLGTLKEGELDLLVDYSIPQYRDCSIGQFLYDRLREKGVTRAVYSGSTENHLDYLERLGFVPEDGRYVKNL